MQDQVEYTGRLYRYKTSFGSKGRWKETWLVLLKNGLLTWFNDKRCSRVSGEVQFANVAHKLRVGLAAVRQFGEAIPKPPIDYGSDSCYIALPFKKDYQWFYLKQDTDLQDWLKAFATSLQKLRLFQQLKDQFEQQKRSKMTKITEEVEQYKILGLNTNLQPDIDWSELWDTLLHTDETELLLENGGALNDTTFSGYGSEVSDTGAFSSTNYAYSNSVSDKELTNAETAVVMTTMKTFSHESNLVDEVMTVVAEVHEDVDHF